MNVYLVTEWHIKYRSSAWFEPVRSKLDFFHQEKGEEYIQRSVLLPTIRFCCSSVVGPYTPEHYTLVKECYFKQEIF